MSKNIEKCHNVVEEIGKGTFGTVYKIYNENTKNTEVVKKIKIDYIMKFNCENYVIKEIEILKILKTYCSEYFLCFLNWYMDSYNYYIITEFLGEYIDGFDYIYNNKYTYDNIEKISINLIRGLRKLHSLEICHRDININNIMININNDNIKYIDFGYSCLRNECNTLFKLGTPRYFSPEIIRKKHYEFITYEDWIKQDIWSLGITILSLVVHDEFYHKIYKNNPFYNGDNYILSDISNRYNINIDIYIPYIFKKDYPILYNWIITMIDYNPNNRLLPNI